MCDCGLWEIEGSSSDELTWRFRNDITLQDYVLNICPGDEFCECTGEDSNNGECTCVADAMASNVILSSYKTTIYIEEEDAAGKLTDTPYLVTINVDALNLYLTTRNTYLSVQKIPLNEVAGGLRHQAWTRDDGTGTITPLEVLADPTLSPEHFKRIESADISQPVVLVVETDCDESGPYTHITHIVDGYHRVANAFHSGKKFIPAYTISLDDMLAFQTRHFSREFAKLAAMCMREKCKLSKYRQTLSRREF